MSDKTYYELIVFYFTLPLYGQVVFWVITVVVIYCLAKCGLLGILFGGGSDNNKFGGGSYSGGGGSSRW